MPALPRLQQLRALNREIDSTNERRRVAERRLTIAFRTYGSAALDYESTKKDAETVRLLARQVDSMNEERKALRAQVTP